MILNFYVRFRALKLSKPMELRFLFFSATRSQNRVYAHFRFPVFFPVFFEKDRRNFFLPRRFRPETAKSPEVTSGPVLTGT